MRTQKGKCIDQTGTRKKLSVTGKSLEIWKPVRGLEFYYSVSNLGRVSSRFKILKPRVTRGYLYVVLEASDGEFRFRRNIPVHRLVAQEFVPNRLERKEVNHKDGNKINNRSDNLEWVSRQENQRHAYAMGLAFIPTPKTKFTKEQVNEVFVLRKKDLKHREIAERLGMGISTVTHILLGTRRKKIDSTL